MNITNEEILRATQEEIARLKAESERLDAARTWAAIAAIVSTVSLLLQLLGVTLCG